MSWIKAVINKFVNLFDGGPPECKMPGCNQPCYVEDNGRVHDFCGKTHAREYRAMKDKADAGEGHEAMHIENTGQKGPAQSEELEVKRTPSASVTAPVPASEGTIAPPKSNSSEAVSTTASGNTTCIELINF